MKFRRIIILLIPTLILVLSYTSFLHGAPKTLFNIIYTNDVMGEVEPCG